MQKFKDILEKNVQWIAMGFGVLFLGLMVWWYVLQQPAFVTINGKQLGPGEINQQIMSGPVDRLKKDLLKPAPEMPVKDYVSVFVADMGFVNPAFDQKFALLNPRNFVGGSTGITGDSVGPGIEGAPMAEISAPPVAPPLTDIQLSSGRLVGKWPDPKWVQAKNNPAAVPAMLEGDIDWVTVGGKISAEELQAAFKEVFAKHDLPPNVYETKLLRVEMVREEKLPDGKWANQTTVPALKIHAGIPPFPGSKATAQEKLEYLYWVDNNAELIGRPAFYEWAKGPQWHAPGDIVPVVERQAIAPQAAAPFDPANPPKRKLTAKEKRQVDEYKKRMKGMRVPPGGYPPGFGPKISRYETINMSGPGPKGASQSNKAQEEYIRRMMQNSKGGRQPYGPYGRPPGLPGGPMPQPGNFGHGTGGVGTINVASLTEDIQVWAHDETAIPGKTYRYRLRYSILNPIFNTVGIAKNKALSEILSINSEESEWSKPVRITDRVNFWLATLPNGAKEVKFDVFLWKEGEWQNKKVNAAPGDLIKGTTWSVVDIRKLPRTDGYLVMLVDDLGNMDRRTWARDENDPVRIQLQEEVEANSGAAAAALGR